MTLALTGRPHGETEPRKATYLKARAQCHLPDLTGANPRRFLREKAARVLGNQWLKWLHLKGQNNLTEGTNKNDLEVPGKGRKTWISETSRRSPLSRVGQVVIDLRCSDYTNLAQRMVRHGLSASELWRRLPWKKFRRSLFRLQKRVYKASRAGDRRKARSLQKLILKSTSARMMAIRQVTQLNAGKRTAGVDGKSSLTFQERFDLNDQLKTHVDSWQHQGLREIPIPKKNGKVRLLKVPTMADRAWQCLAKYALEPAHEATC